MNFFGGSFDINDYAIRPLYARNRVWFYLKLRQEGILLRIWVVKIHDP